MPSSQRQFQGIQNSGFSEFNRPHPSPDITFFNASGGLPSRVGAGVLGYLHRSLQAWARFVRYTCRWSSKAIHIQIVRIKSWIKGRPEAIEMVFNATFKSDTSAVPADPLEFDEGKYEYMLQIGVMESAGDRIENETRRGLPPEKKCSKSRDGVSLNNAPVLESRVSEAVVSSEDSLGSWQHWKSYGTWDQLAESGLSRGLDATVGEAHAPRGRGREWFVDLQRRISLARCTEAQRRPQSSLYTKWERTTQRPEARRRDNFGLDASRFFQGDAATLVPEPLSGS
ncbi:hypothetical protein C8R44DRAFT_748966 [Mycena epipterygia]|nr:hypothetical protein C8R44DRAFT_748966 [Mycena epipterygia]